MVRRMKDNLNAYVSFAKVKRNKPVDENKENLVLQSEVETPRTSLRHIEEIPGIARSTAGSILKRHKYHPYRERPCQGLQDGDYTIRRMAFCEWFIQNNNEILIFFLQILWSDESLFIRTVDSLNVRKSSTTFGSFGDGHQSALYNFT